jgi:hypothetical protein
VFFFWGDGLYVDEVVSLNIPAAIFFRFGSRNLNIKVQVNDTSDTNKIINVYYDCLGLHTSGMSRGVTHSGGQLKCRDGYHNVVTEITYKGLKCEIHIFQWKGVLDPEKKPLTEKFVLVVTPKRVV